MVVRPDTASSPLPLYSVAGLTLRNDIFQLSHSTHAHLQGVRLLISEWTKLIS